MYKGVKTGRSRQGVGNKQAPIRSKFVGLVIVAIRGTLLGFGVSLLSLLELLLSLLSFITIVMNTRLVTGTTGELGREGPLVFHLFPGLLNSELEERVGDELGADVEHLQLEVPGLDEPQFLASS